VNFTVTELGLEDQLLSLVVRHERLDLATTSEKLVTEQNGFKIQVKELEDQILYKLATAEGDITEDVELIEGLEDSKRIANDIERKVVEALEIQAHIRETSEKYRSVAARSSLLFFLMSDLVKIHTYYIYSLAAFTKVFQYGMDKVSDAAKRAKQHADEDEDEAGKAGGDNGDDAGAERADAEGAERAKDEDDDDGGGGGGGESGSGKSGLVAEVSDDELAARCVVLAESITLTVFNYVRRGLFETDKLTVATMLTLAIQAKSAVLSAEEIDYLVAGKVSTDPGNMGALTEWLPGALWPKIKALEGLKVFKKLGDDVQNDDDDWHKWFEHPRAEEAKLPGEYKDLGLFHQLILLRAVRPDRVTTALAGYVAASLGSREFVESAPFDMAQCFSETAPNTPVFFVLFAGVDPTPWVETLGKSLGFTIENGRFVNISMGQGQEGPAETVLEKFAREGGWVMLQNCHLMQSWVPKLERLFEILSEDAHPDFRLYLSAEPPPLSTWKNMPESLMQGCVKVANEAPADIQSNLRSAWANFSEERIERCTKRSEFKACLFALCWFHSIMLGRIRFGQQGWSRKYSFNTGDLTICADVLSSYLDDNATVPWDDLRYLFGEIMYGGHITDAWDRRTNNTYLEVIVNEGLFTGRDLAAGSGFASPNPDDFDYAAYVRYIDEEMVPEAPTLFGLHPNAEIGYMTVTCESLFKTVLGISGGGGGGGDGDGGGGGGDGVRAIMDDLLERLPANFEMVGMGEKAKPLQDGPTGPYVTVAVQECSRMNVLLSEIRRTLVDLDKGLKGQLNMSAAMEDLVVSLTTNEVPGRNPFGLCSWEKHAWFSNKGLVSWFLDMIKRCDQLEAWTDELVRPFSLWLPGMFNPTAFLTAVMQVTARDTKMPLDQMSTETHVSSTLLATNGGAEACAHHPQDGAFIHGVYMEGARWSTEDDDLSMAGKAAAAAAAAGGGTSGTEGVEPTDLDGLGTVCGGCLMDSRLKELLAPMPLIYVKAVRVQPQWEASAVGYLRHDDAVYDCPVYITTFRGPTYVVLATLRTVDPVSKWVLAGVALVFQTDD
jgi:dynein heavy chain